MLRINIFSCVGWHRKRAYVCLHCEHLDWWEFVIFKIQIILKWKWKSFPVLARSHLPIENMGMGKRIIFNVFHIFELAQRMANKAQSFFSLLFRLLLPPTPPTKYSNLAIYHGYNLFSLFHSKFDPFFSTSSFIRWLDDWQPILNWNV